MRFLASKSRKTQLRFSLNDTFGTPKVALLPTQSGSFAHLKCLFCPPKVALLKHKNAIFKQIKTYIQAFLLHTLPSTPPTSLKINGLALHAQNLPFSRGGLLEWIQHAVLSPKKANIRQVATKCAKRFRKNARRFRNND